MKKHTTDIAGIQIEKSNIVTLKWSDVLESAFDYYYTEYLPAWTMNQTSFNNSGDKIFISKKNKEWLSWEKIEKSNRPDIATLFDLLPDLPEDKNYWQLIRSLTNESIKDPEDHFWENVFTYKPAKEVESNGRMYQIEWEA